MFFKLKSHIKFFLKSTNQHGVHSPFVFNYLTKCLYKKPRKSKDKTLDVLIKSIAYFKFTKINVIGNSYYEKELQKYFTNLTFNSQKIDVLLFNSPINVESKTIFSKYSLHNNSLIIFNNIQENFEAYTSWSEFISSKKASVSIDMFYCGVIFIREEQQKEHFTIRI